MPLRHSPLLTPRSLDARRSNALKSTGPRTPGGKARVSLNALKHGRACGPAGRAPRFRERLLRAGYPCQEALYGDLRSCLAQAFGAQTPRARRRIDQMAASAWCRAAGRGTLRTKLESASESEAECSRFLSQGRAEAFVYRAEDPWLRIGIVFWRQHRRFLTEAWLKRVRAGLQPVSAPGANEGLESRIRCRVFRLRRPGYFERLRYGLDRDGNPDPDCELRRRIARTGKVPRRRRVAVTLGPGCEPEAALLESARHLRVRVAAGAPSSPEKPQSAESPAETGPAVPTKRRRRRSRGVRSGIARKGKGSNKAQAGKPSLAGAIAGLSRRLSAQVLGAGRSAVRRLSKVLGH